MDRSDSISQWMAQLATVAGVVLAALGVGTVVLGTALYDGRVLCFPLAVQMAVVVGEIGLGMVPCGMLLRAARLALREELGRASNLSVAGGMVLLPGVAAVALFKTLANPCWNNPGCTGSPSVEDGILTAGPIVLLLAAAVALLLSPLFLTIARPTAAHGARGHET